MTTAGFPAATVFGGTDFVTTEPAATTELSPIVTPRMIVHRSPIHTFRPMTTGAISAADGGLLAKLL